MPSFRQSTGTGSKSSTPSRAVNRRNVVSTDDAGNSTTNTRVRRMPSNYSNYSPTRAGDKASGVGLLEAEFFAIQFLLITELFAGTGSYGDKMISTMKRGTLTIMLFFILAMVAGIGPNAAKVSKALGALVFVAILLSSPGNTILVALDTFIKADWIASDSSSADTGTQNAQGTAVGTATGKATSATQQLSASLKTALNKLLPGLGSEVALQAEGVGAQYDVDRLAAGILSGNPTAIKNAAAAFGDKVKSTLSDLFHFF